LRGESGCSAILSLGLFEMPKLHHCFGKTEARIGPVRSARNRRLEQSRCRLRLLAGEQRGGRSLERNR